MKMKMTRAFVRTLSGRLNEPMSTIYPYIKDEIADMDLSVDEAFGLNETVCFEDDYCAYWLDMAQRQLPVKRVVDIGCMCGFQSFLFDDYEYIGIDMFRYSFFRDHGNYIVGRFPEDFEGTDLFSNSIVIANMSLGFFAKSEEDCYRQAEALSQCKYLYLNAPLPFFRMAEKHFKFKEPVINKWGASRENRYYKERYFLTNEDMEPTIHNPDASKQL